MSFFRVLHYRLSSSCTYRRTKPVSSFSTKLTNHEGETFKVCETSPPVLEGSDGKVLRSCSPAELQWDLFWGFAWYVWIVWLSPLSFLTVWRKQGEQLASNRSSGERLVCVTPPAVWAALQPQSILPYKFTTDSQWQVLARYRSAELCAQVCLESLKEARV